MGNSTVVTATNKEESWLNALKKKSDEELIEERERLHGDAFKLELQSIINYLVIDKRKQDRTVKQLAEQLKKVYNEIEELTKEKEKYKKEQEKFLNQITNQKIILLQREEEIHELKAQMVRCGLFEAATK